MTRLKRPKGSTEIKARKKLLKDYLQTKFSTQTVSALVATTWMNRHWGLLVDWHEFSEVLSEMEAEGTARHAGFESGRITRYYIPSKAELEREEKVF